MLQNLRTKQLYVDPESSARRQAEAWLRDRPADSALISEIASQPQAIWLNGDHALQSFRLKLAHIKENGSLPVVVSYSIPHRDVGQYSAGGATAAADYRAFTAALAGSLAGLDAILIWEPDALAQLDGLEGRQREERLNLLAHSIELLSARPNLSLYVDVGHPHWHSARNIAKPACRYSGQRQLGVCSERIQLGRDRRMRGLWAGTLPSSGREAFRR